MQDIDVIFFDLFFTLIKPEYHPTRNENDILGLSIKEWEDYAENKELYLKRAITKGMTSMEIIDEIAATIPFPINQHEKEYIVQLRESRMRNALTYIDAKIISTLTRLASNGIRLCLISNADAIDTKYWSDSLLAPYFEKVFFSCEVGYLKPDKDIYEIAMKAMNTTATRSLFVGDGGFEELRGAKEVGMKTVFSEYLAQKEDSVRKNLVQYADYSILDFSELLQICNIG